MSAVGSSAFETLKNEQYTGENRCLPCTLVNTVIAAVLAVVAAVLALPLGTASGAAIGAGVFLACLAVIYLNGYLVPKTPELTQRYLPDHVLRWFDKGSTTEDTIDLSKRPTIRRIRYYQENKVNPEEYLRRIGAVEDCDDVDDICMTDGLAQHFEHHEDRLQAERPDTSVIAEVFGTDEANVEYVERDAVAINIDRNIRRWPSEAALLSDVAMHYALEELDPDWPAVPLRQREKMLKMFRHWNEECSKCGGEVQFSEELVDSCCGKYKVHAKRCTDCGEHFAEIAPKNVKAHIENSGLRT